jgi:kynurenine formamidase
MAAQSPLPGGLDSARVYDLAHPLDADTPVSASHPPFRLALMRRHGDLVRDDGMSGANELMTLGGHNGTHIDALCHVALDGRLHGGVDAVEASRGGRFTAHGIETIAPIVCRGVLLDIPALDGRTALDAGEAVTADDLARACEVQGVAIGAGDAVLVRSGWPIDHYASGELMLGHESGVPGPNTSAARWLAERGVRVTGSDTIAYEHLAPGTGHTRLPVHVILLVEHGIHIIEMLDLEELARDQVHEFWFVAAPLKIVGATGSPLRPLAIVP